MAAAAAWARRLAESPEEPEPLLAVGRGGRGPWNMASTSAVGSSRPMPAQEGPDCAPRPSRGASMVSPSLQGRTRGQGAGKVRWWAL